MSSLPKSRIIVGYNDFFPDEPLSDRLSLIRGISKTDLMAEISGLNYRLKPNDVKYTDYSLEGQDRELFYFCGGNQKLYAKYGTLARKFIRGPKGYPLLFTRQSCLFAMEEIQQSDIPAIENFSMRSSWEFLLKYLLAVNNVVAAIRRDNREETTEDNASDSHPDKRAVPLKFEDINVKMIVLNELNLGSDQIYLTFRALHLLAFLTTHEQLGQLAIEHLQGKYKADYRRFVFDIISLYIGNNPDKKNNVKNSEIGFELDTTFIYYPKPDTEKLFVELSQVYKNDSPEKLLSVRKFPFYNAGKAFYVMDNTFLLEKSYSQFINDFWFDTVKLVKDDNGKSKFDIRYYRAAIGQFFESYIRQSVEFMMMNAKHFKVRLFNELFVIENGNRIEFTDVYIRYTNRIFLGEAKATGIYDKEKYSGDLNEFYRNGREAFFDAFGMEQITCAVKRLKALAEQFDPGFPKTGTLKVFPAIIVNEKALQTPLMAQVFNNRFQELVVSKQIDLRQIRLAPLAVIHVGDFENMEEKVNNDPSAFWRILERQALNTVFMPPFFHTMNLLKIKPGYDRPGEAIYELMDEFTPSDNIEAAVI